MIISLLIYFLSISSIFGATLFDYLENIDLLSPLTGLASY